MCLEKSVTDGGLYTVQEKDFGVANTESPLKYQFLRRYLPQKHYLEQYSTDQSNNRAE